jgi:hypothetical protein
MSQSNLATAVDAASKCSDDEIRQLVAMLNARLGNVSAVVNRGNRGAKGAGDQKGGKGKAKGGKPRKKGNPQRTSQYETNPVYREYRAAKRACEAQKKEEPYKGLLFHELPLYEAYQEKLTAWMKAKSGFRGKARKSKEQSSDGEEGVVPPEAETALAQVDGTGSTASHESAGSAGPPSRKRSRTDSSSTSKSKPSGRYSDPPASYTGTPEEFQKLNRTQRKKLIVEAEASTEQMEQGE